jgi:hypothetical protein
VFKVPTFDSNALLEKAYKLAFQTIEIMSVCTLYKASDKKHIGLCPEEYPIHQPIEKTGANDMCYKPCKPIFRLVKPEQGKPREFLPVKTYFLKYNN